MCPGASNWRDWDSEAATGQTESLSPAAEEIHLVRTYMCVCVYINIYIYTYLFSLVNLHPTQRGEQERECL